MKRDVAQNLLQNGHESLARSILAVFFAGIVVVNIVGFVAPENDDLVTFLFYTPIYFVLGFAWLALRRGNTVVAGHVLSGMFFLMAVAAVVVLGGIRANATAAFLLCIMVAAALISSRSALFWTVLGIGAVTAMAGLEVAGLMPAAVAPPDSLVNAFLGTVLPIAFTVFVLHSMLTLRQTALDAAAERERERDKAEADLIQAQKMDVVGRLSSGIAHDFNNLLTVIQSSVDVLKLEGADDPLLDDIDHAARRASMLTRRLLAFARPAEADARPLDLSEFLEDFAPLLQTIAGDETALSLDIAPDCRTLIDPMGFQQIVLNLVINSREAQSGRGNIDISLQQIGKQIVLEVSDSGPGIPAEIRDTIFDPFFTTKTSGTGLGLATVKQLVDSSAGTIEVRNGGGATFSIRWPAHQADDLSEASLTTEEREAIRRLNVLVVDDNEPVRRTMATLLGTNMWDVIEASDGLEALSVLERLRPDIIVTDNSMPGITGEELARKVRELYPALPILIVSGNPLEELPIDGCRFLPKPFGGAALVSAIEELLSATEAPSSDAAE
jgi:signal transduction histidine kinase